MLNARDFTARLWCLNGRDLPFVAVPLARLPAERRASSDSTTDDSPVGPTRAEEIEILRQRVVGRPIAEIRRDPDAMALVKAMGPDQNVIDFAFNLIDETGRPQASIDLFNRFNGRIYDTFHVGAAPMEPVGNHPFMMTKTIFQRATYGDAFIDTFARRLGLSRDDADPPESIFCLRCTIMNPFLGGQGLSDDGISALYRAFADLEKEVAAIADIYRDRVT